MSLLKDGESKVLFSKSQSMTLCTFKTTCSSQSIGWMENGFNMGNDVYQGKYSDYLVFRNKVAIYGKNLE